MNKEFVRLLAKEATTVLADLGDKLSLKVTYAGGNFSPNNAVLKFEFAIVGEGGQARSRIVEDWEQYAPRYGLPKDGVGMRFVVADVEYEIVGWKKGNSRYPVIAKKMFNGKQYKMSPQMVVSALIAGG